MMLLGPLVLIAIVAAVVAAVRHRPGAAQEITTATGAGAQGQRGHRATAAGTADLDQRLHDWVDAGLIGEQQATAVLAYEAALRRTRGAAAPAAPTPRRAQRVPAVAEALGYLGGILAAVGLTLLVAHWWPDLGDGLRLLVAATVTVALVGGGVLVHEALDPAFARLRWTLWLAAAATAGVAAHVITRNILDVATDEYVVAATVGGAAALSGLLWWGHERPVQEFVLFGGGLVAVGTALSPALDEAVSGSAIWVLAVAVLAVGLARRVASPAIAVVVGSVGAIGGAFITAGQWDGGGLLFGMATVAILLLTACQPHLALEPSHTWILLVVSGIGALQGGPPTIVHFARDGAVTTGLVVWVLGVLLLLATGGRLLRFPIATELLGGLAVIGGAAITVRDLDGLGTVFGLVSAIGLIAMGMLPGRVLDSLLGSVGLLVNVPWAISHYFPGEGRAPLLILVSGAMILAVSVLLSRQGGRLRTELGQRTGEGAADEPVRSDEFTPQSSG